MLPLFTWIYPGLPKPKKVTVLMTVLTQNDQAFTEMPDAAKKDNTRTLLRTRRRRLGEIDGLPTQCVSLFEFMMGEIPSVCAHCLMTAGVAKDFGIALKFSDHDTRLLISSGLLHDIGKLFVPRKIVLKPSPLNDDERESMQDHVHFGERYVGNFVETKLMSTIIGQHHERYDGLGYPRCYSGEGIHPIARALSIVDAFCAMTESRLYRYALSSQEAYGELLRCSGTQFDPNFVKVFLTLNSTAWDSQRMPAEAS